MIFHLLDIFYYISKIKLFWILTEYKNSTKISSFQWFTTNNIWNQLKRFNWTLLFVNINHLNETIHRLRKHSLDGTIHFENKWAALLTKKNFSLQTVGHGQRLVAKFFFVQIDAKSNFNECVCALGTCVKDRLPKNEIPGLERSCVFLFYSEANFSSGATESFQNLYLLNKFYRIQIIEGRWLIWWSHGFF